MTPRRYFSAVIFAPTPYIFKKENCKHVYKNTNVGTCTSCKKPTHDIDWEKEHALKKAHIEEKGFFHNEPGTWWSI